MLYTPNEYTVVINNRFKTPLQQATFENIATKESGRQWCRNRASVSRTNGPGCESRDESGLPLGFVHTNGASTG